jgi:hypothetical protein
MNVLDLAGVVTVATAALWTLWGAAARVERGRHRRIDADDAYLLAALRARWSVDTPHRHAITKRPEPPVYVAVVRIRPTLPAAPEPLRLEGRKST